MYNKNDGRINVIYFSLDFALLHQCDLKQQHIVGVIVWLVCQSDLPNQEMGSSREEEYFSHNKKKQKKKTMQIMCNR